MTLSDASIPTTCRSEATAVAMPVCNRVELLIAIGSNACISSEFMGRERLTVAIAWSILVATYNPFPRKSACWQDGRFGKSLPALTFLIDLRVIQVDTVFRTITCGGILP